MAGKPSQPDHRRARFDHALVEKADGLISRDDFGANVLVLLRQPMHAPRRRQIRFSAEHHHTLGAAARGWQEGMRSFQTPDLAARFLDRLPPGHIFLALPPPDHPSDDLQWSRRVAAEIASGQELTDEKHLIPARVI